MRSYLLVAAVAFGAALLGAACGVALTSAAILYLLP